MIRINLLPVKEAQAEAGRRQELRLVGLVLAVVALLCVAVRFERSRANSQLETRIVELEGEVKTLDEKVGEVADLDKKRKSLDAKIEVITSLERRRTGPVYALADLSRATPDRLWLTEMSEFAGSGTLAGKAIDNQEIAQFLRELAASPFFRDVDLVETKQEDVGPVKLRSFSIKATVDYAATAGKEEKAKESEGEGVEG